MILMQPIHFQKCTRGHAIRTICKQYSRGPASQVGYQRERDVTGEFPFRRFEPCIGPLLFFPNSNFHKLFSFNYSGMVGSTGVNGTDDSDELMRKLRAL